MADEPVFRYSRVGFSFEVYPNRIDISEKSGLLGFFGAKRESILLRNVNDVSVTGGISRKLRIATTDGKKQEFVVGAKAEEARKAILSVL